MSDRRKKRDIRRAYQTKDFKRDNDTWGETEGQTLRLASKNELITRFLSGYGCYFLPHPLSIG
jgi:hypothetical protein